MAIIVNRENGIDMYYELPKAVSFDDFNPKPLPPTQAYRAYDLCVNNQMRFYAVPNTQEPLGVSEIENFILTQTGYIRSTDAEYNRGYNEALKTVYEFIRKRKYEDSNRKEEINDNCC